MTKPILHEQSGEHPAVLGATGNVKQPLIRSAPHQRTARANACRGDGNGFLLTGSCAPGVVKKVQRQANDKGINKSERPVSRIAELLAVHAERSSQVVVCAICISLLCAP